MDVHDTNLISRNIPLESGMVITVEPGFYIPRNASSKYFENIPEEFRGVGIRIEDDVLITKDDKTGALSCEVLSGSCPKDVENLF